MPLNVKLLRKVKAQILKEPAQFAMTKWFTRDIAQANEFAEVLDIRRRVIPNCGTAACIAGWAVAIHKESNPELVARSYYMPYDANDALDLDDDNSHLLYHVARWPRKFLERWRRARSMAARARVAADRIEHFIATGGAE